MKKDILKVIAYIRVYGLDIYGKKHTNLDTGKNNLSSYFCDKLDWSEAKLKRITTLLLKEGVLKKEAAEPGFKFYSLSYFVKSYLPLLGI